MNCPNCGTPNPDNNAFCSNCGAAMNSGQNVFTTPVPEEPVPPVRTTIQIPEEYKPISAWGYIGYSILFGIPLIGFILLCVFSFGGAKNKNLRNYARSGLISILIAIVLVIILAVVATAAGLDWQEFFQRYSSTYTY